MNGGRRLTFGSLFAGIGGLDLGLERAGLVCEWQVERDDFCRRVLSKHWPDVPKFGDILDVYGVNSDAASVGRGSRGTRGSGYLKPVDLICGGFPCQPFSAAGKRRGKEDNRFLWPEMVRVIAEVRPAWVLGENVPGLVALQLDDCLSDLEALGYTVWTVALPACAFDAPHRRERVFIVAHSGSERRQQESRGASQDEAAHEGRTAQHGDESQRDGEGSRARTVADSDERRREGERIAKHSSIEGPPTSQPNGRGQGRRRNGSPLADAASQGPAHDCEDDERSKLAGRNSARRGGISGVGWLHTPASWEPEPDVGRVANGVPHRVDRLRALGNAVVPSVAEHLGRLILAATAATLDE